MTQIHFILNNTEINEYVNPSVTLLDYLRYNRGLVGTKIGCREGDCGACIVLLGDIAEDNLKYRNITSCLTPMGNVTGKHVVTVEGINMSNRLTLPQQLLVDNGGTQCGFCTVGFVMSLTAYALNANHTNVGVLDWIDGNICRCTGYKSIEKAALQLEDHLKAVETSISWIDSLVDNYVLPQYFTTIYQNIEKIKPKSPRTDISDTRIIGGGSDLYVRQHDDLIDLQLQFLNQRLAKFVKFEDGTFKIGAAITASEFISSKIIQRELPQLPDLFKLIASMPIRNIATFAGNIANASPIADFVSLLLVLDAELKLNSGRSVKLDQFYQGYKQFDLQDGEIIEEIHFPWPNENRREIHFEKVSKRLILDIASVNSSILLQMDNGTIQYIRISAGGIAPIPLYLRKTSEFATGKNLDREVLEQMIAIMYTEISPISDIRGSKEYKKLLLRQLLVAHFMELTSMGELLQEVVL